MTTIRSSAISSTVGGSFPAISGLGAQIGDVVVVVYGVNFIGTISDNNGATPFTKDYEVQEISSGFTSAVFSRRIQSGDPTTFNFTDSGNDQNTAIAVCFQDSHASDIYDVAPASGNTTVDTGGTTGDSPSITTLTANAFHVVAVGGGPPLGTINSTPSTYTVAQNGGSGAAAAVATKIIAAAGATGAQTWGWSGDDGTIAFSFAIKAASGGAPSPVLARRIFVMP